MPSHCCCARRLRGGGAKGCTGRRGGWVGLGQILIRTPRPTACPLTRASQLGRVIHDCPVSRPTGLLTAPVTHGGTCGREMPPCLCVWGSVLPGRVRV